MVDRYRVSRIFLAGDAAHVHSPAGGQGMNTGIQDAYNLGWKLALAFAGGPDWLLDTYEEERLPVAAGMLGITTKLHKQMMPRQGAGVGRRDAEFLQLSINYRHGRLTRELRSGAPGLQAGDRAPDAPCQRAGETVRLFDLFRGPHWTLLGYGRGMQKTMAEGNPLRLDLHTHMVLPHPEAGGIEEITDAADHFQDAYGMNDGDWALVRPDGYLALMTGGDAAEVVSNYLIELTTGH